MMYRYFWLIGHLAFPAFIRRLFYVGKERLPAKPLFLALNHPNSFLDGVIVNTFSDRPVFSLVRGDVFRNPVARWWLRQFKLEPIFRAQDVEVAGENVKKNEETVEACERILASDRGAINIFVEGLSVQEKRLRPLRKGLARMALQIESQSGWTRDIHVLPVGVNYTCFESYDVEVMVEFGEAFPVKPLREVYEKNPNKAVKMLQTQIEQGLRPLVLHIADPAMDAAVEPLLEIVRQRLRLPLLPWKTANPSRFKAEKQLADWANGLAQSQPEAWQALAERSLAWQQLLDAARIEARTVANRGKAWPTDLLLLVLLALPAIAGWAIHVVPKEVIHYFANSKFRKTVFYDSVYIGGAMALQGIWLFVWTLACLPFSWMLALALWAIFPATLLSARIWELALKRLRAGLRFRQLSHNQQHVLVQMHADLLAGLPA